MNNQIQTIWTIWHNPEYKSWKNIYYDLVPRKVYWAARRAGRGHPAVPVVTARMAAEGKPKFVLEYIFNWNMTWWQNNGR